MNITPYQAVKRMKELTELGITFSFSFMTLDNTRKESNGIKTVNKALLRKSMRADQSDLSHDLISYTDLNNRDVPRHFYLSLLLKFNEYTIKP